MRVIGERNRLHDAAVLHLFSTVFISIFPAESARCGNVRFRCVQTGKGHKKTKANLGFFISRVRHIQLG